MNDSNLKVTPLLQPASDFWGKRKGSNTDEPLCSCLCSSYLEGLVRSHARHISHARVTQTKVRTHFRMWCQNVVVCPAWWGTVFSAVIAEPTADVLLFKQSLITIYNTSILYCVQLFISRVPEKPQMWIFDSLYFHQWTETFNYSGCQVFGLYNTTRDGVGNIYNRLIMATN